MYEVVNAQAVDVVVIGRPLFFEIATQIVAIRLDGIGQLHQRQVVLQVQLLAVLGVCRGWGIGNGLRAADGGRRNDHHG